MIKSSDSRRGHLLISTILKMLKYLGRLKIPGRITGYSLSENLYHNPVDSLFRNDVNTRESDGCGILWCYDIEPHNDYDDYNASLLVVISSNQHTLNVNGHKSLLLTRGDVIAFRSDITHSLTRPSNRRALFCALFIDSENRKPKFDMERAKGMLESITQIELLHSIL